MFPLLSLASHVTSVCPIVKSLPDRGIQTIEEMDPELSVAIGTSHSTMAVPWPSSAILDLLLPQVIIGASTSGE